MNRGFIDELVERIRFVEPEDIGHYLQLLVAEKGFLETIFNAILEGVIVTDPQDRIIYMNRAACTFFGMTRCGAHRPAHWDRLSRVSIWAL